MERINIRELVAWIGEPNEEDTLMAAEDYLRMGIAKLSNTKIPVPKIESEIFNEILVIGGGITGISAAIEGAKAGYNVHIVEKEKNPGGWVRKLYKQGPGKAPFSQLVNPVISEKIVEAENLENIVFHNSSAIKNIDGQPGEFEVTIELATLPVGFV